MVTLTTEGAQAPSAFFRPPPIIPKQLINAIDTAILADRGFTFRKHLRAATFQLEDAFRGEEPLFRSYLGASILGNDCPRAVWYDFRWATEPAFPGRILRLFNRGHMEEARFIAYFKMLDGDIRYAFDGVTPRKWFSFKFAAGHGSGSCDGIGKDLPYLQHKGFQLLEFKTHGESSFTDLAGSPQDWRRYLQLDDGVFPGQGVRDAHPTHYVQMQLYMHGLGPRSALYCAVNKNTDDLYMEEVPYNREIAEQYIDRAQMIVDSSTPPPKINESPGFYKCKMCNHKTVCHEDRRPDTNCRTCQHSRPGAATSPEDQGVWICGKHRKRLSPLMQFEACSDHSPPTYWGSIPF
jgi:hypothetical protein